MGEKKILITFDKGFERIWIQQKAEPQHQFFKTGLKIRHILQICFICNWNTIAPQG